MAKIAIVHGPNLNLLGQREPAIYGNQTLQQINDQLFQLGASLKHEMTAYQSNHEGVLIDYLQQLQADFILFNPAAFTHTSIALRDCLLAINIPFIEVHLSNIFERESFRQHSYFNDIAVKTIMGHGTKSYELALLAADEYLKVV